MTNYYNKDLYKILNINYTASNDEIKLSYRKLVRIFHPDVSGNNQNIDKFKEIQEAYEILINEETRKKYDILRGFYREKIKNNYEKTSASKNKYDDYIKKAKIKADAGESFSKSINDALDNLFHTQNKKKTNKEPKIPINGEDINIDLTISCFEALNGTNRKVNILHTQPCTNCEGRKFINEAVCPMCNGSGQLSLQKKINVKIPKGVKENSKIRVKKEGNKGLNGGKDGDLYLIINIEKNPYFEIEGMNILCNLPITPFEAVLGAEIPINVLNDTITVKVPAMTSSGQKLRLSGLGLDNKSKTRKGDIIITVIIKLPEKISKSEEELYSKLKDISEFDIRKDMKNAR